uniref:UDP-N-acetylglucosamine transferase subunit ALG13 n=1 Tax=Junco hyemalis TaxID=40217 RepID=A0A8C5IHP1_JUNHY
MKSVFVTVGTTSFDELIATARSPPALQALQSRGYQRLVLQVGRGSLPFFTLLTISIDPGERRSPG